jgi:hypothetical protein
MVEPDRPQIQYILEHVPCLLDNHGYRHTLKVCNTYCFSTAAMVARTCINYVFIRACFFSFFKQLKTNAITQILRVCVCPVVQLEQSPLADICIHINI